LRKFRPNSPIHPDAIRHSFDIRTARIADRGNGVDIRNLEREKRVGGVFDQLPALLMSVTKIGAMKGS
jgi:hypothetical protein